MSDIALQPAHALAESLRRRDVSSRELLEHYLARVERLNASLNAVVTLDPDGARRAADAADAATARGEAGGPLHGVPMTIKDTYQTAGVRTTCGLAAWDHVPTHDAEAVRRLRDAGAVIFGKTNTPTLAGDWQSYNPIFGTTNNPWDTTRTAGGSSGGAAAAVAAGLTALELGSDIAGSIRVPSNWCGVCGHKPTWGVVPQQGHLPPAPGTLSSTDLNVIGPIGRSVDDLELALGVLAGPAGQAAVGWRLELPAPRGTTLGELRLALWLDDPAYPVEPEIGDVLVSAVAALRANGAQLLDTPPDVVLSDVVRTYQQLLYPILLSTIAQPRFDHLEAVGQALPAEDDGPLARTARFATQRYRDWVFANEKRERLRAQMAEFFRGVDALTDAGRGGARHPARPQRALRRPVDSVERWQQAIHRHDELDRAGDPDAPSGHRGSHRPHRVRAAGGHTDRRTVSRGPHDARGGAADRGVCSAAIAPPRCVNQSRCSANVQNCVPGGPPKQPTS